MTTFSDNQVLLMRCVTTLAGSTMEIHGMFPEIECKSIAIDYIQRELEKEREEDPEYDPDNEDPPVIEFEDNIVTYITEDRGLELLSITFRWFKPEELPFGDLYKENQELEARISKAHQSSLSISKKIDTILGGKTLEEIYEEGLKKIEESEDMLRKMDTILGGEDLEDLHKENIECEKNIKDKLRKLQKSS